MKVLLTGISGFVAARLATLSEENGRETGRPEAGSADYIVHFAGLGAGTTPADHLIEDLRALEGALQTAARDRTRFALVSSEAVSGKPRSAPLDEYSPSILEAGSGELDSAAAGLLAEHLCFAYRSAFGLHATILRLFGAYGPGQPVAGEDGGIGDWIAAALQKQPMRSPQDTGAPCCLSHADDLARGILLALERGGADGEIVYLADPRPVQAGALARWIWRLAGNGGDPPFTTNGSSPRKAFRAPVDTAKAQRLFGFTAAMDHERGLAETIKWQARRPARR